MTYEVLASPFADGTEQTVSDLVYPYTFVYRWGANAERGDNAREPQLAPTLAALEERLAGFKVVRVDETTHAIAEGISVVTKTPVVEVYLKAAPGNERQVAGEHTVILGVSLDGNAIEPSARTLRIHRIGATGSPG